MPQIDASRLAEKIARIIESESSFDFSTIQSGMERINERLDRIEFSLNPQSQIPNPKSTHPSMERFAIAEAVADETFSQIRNDKICGFEPNDKPCDHCSMCSARGF